MHMKNSFFIISFSLMLSAASLSALADLSAEKIVGNYLENFYSPGADQTTDIEMELENNSGHIRKRELTMLRMDVSGSGDQKYYIYFHEPSDVKGTAFLIDKFVSRDDDRWLYIPAIKLVKRIAADDKRSSFVGSDFTYEDVSGRDISEEHHALLGDDKFGDRPVYIIESRPKNPIDYYRRVTWIDSERWLPLKEEFYDAQDKIMKEFKAEKIENVNGIWTVTERTMKNMQSQHETRVRYTNIKYNVDLNLNIFNKQSLKRPPRKWIK